MLNDLKQLLTMLHLSTWRAVVGVVALVVVDEDFAAATRSQPCAGSHQLHACLIYTCK
jgi:hypothetical protein